MGYCKNCNLTIQDDTTVCLFCGRVLTKGEEEPTAAYPAIYQKTRMVKRVIVIVTFVLLLVQALLMVLNYYLDKQGRWSWLTGAAILYGLVFLHYTVLRKQSYIRKLFVQMIFTILLLLAIDAILGFQGWSLEYGLPCILLVLDVIVLLGMIIDRNNWVHYMTLQIVALVLSAAYMVLYLTHVTHSALLAWTGLFAAVILFGGTMLAGYRKAKSELRRRFYI
ncbi:MAG: DUF6320 domain-containing protein [Lachnospiraceae bacterium]|nr:DUF6320 domain-containing protein [Lachnospiraceae bacterium]